MNHGDCACCVRVQQLEAEKAALIQQVADLEHSATRDGLTGLYRRNHADRILQSLLQGCDSGETTRIAATFIDLDHFKMINDTYGHPIGDLVLMRVGRVLQSSVRDVDVLSRSRLENTGNSPGRRRKVAGIKERRGGEEFLVYFLNVQDATKKADALREEIAGLRFRGFSELRVKASIGISEMVLVGDTIADDQLSSLVQRADTALYAAKEAGRNQVVHFRDLVARQRHVA